MMGEETPDTGRAVVAALQAAAYLVDDRGCIVTVNAPAEELLGWPTAELLGQDAHEMLHRNRYGAPLPRTVCPFREAILSRRTAQGTDQWLERGDGALQPVSWLSTPFDYGAPHLGTLVIFWSHHAPELPGAWPRQLMSSLTELERLALLAETTTRLSSTLDMEEALHSLVKLVVPRLADWAVVDLITERDEVWRFAVAHAEGGKLVHRDDLEGPMPPVTEESPMPLSRALRGAAATLAGPETYQGPPDAGIAVEQRRLFNATGMHSAIIAPIRSHRRTLGALTLGRSEQPERFTAADLALLEDITRRAGLAVDNALLYDRQRKVAETMQRHLLPRLPRIKGLAMTSRYLPAPDASQVGGDWYDVFMLRDGGTALVIGDVVGHDLEAAAGMAQLRNMLRAYAWVQEESAPSEVVDRLDRASRAIAEASMATLIFGQLTAREDEWELCWTNAGHPPPLLVTHDGVARYLTEGHGILLGLGTGRVRYDATATLPRGSTLVLYTDGLVEAPGQSIDEGLENLRRHAASLARRPLEPFADLLLERARPVRNEDDVALLAVRVPAEPDPDAELVSELARAKYAGL
ncbi:SpoIIE family protein phosphatase [Actinospica robiniae]|uniref:SpoIIE family protein phosphatase n=1 Tax=Actinospica robiniae TaxID=304901 RepID=UPI0003FFE878|nr:SpoIIE family protein phosphatase [Actinospica robiniae]